MVGRQIIIQSFGENNTLNKIDNRGAFLYINSNSKQHKDIDTYNQF